MCGESGDSNGATACPARDRRVCMRSMSLPEALAGRLTIKLLGLTMICRADRRIATLGRARAGDGCARRGSIARARHARGVEALCNHAQSSAAVIPSAVVVGSFDDMEEGPHMRALFVVAVVAPG